MSYQMKYPEKIVCLTEESVEFLYDLGREDLIVGVSCFVERPPQAKEKPILTSFTHANLKKILNTKADLIIGFSDIQKDIARDLIASGENVFVSNHRSLSETLDYLLLLASMIGEEKKGREVIASYIDAINFYQKKAEARKSRPRVYLEEWDEPMIRGIQWFREVVEICGGRDIFGDQSPGSLAKERFVSWDEVCQRDPEIILASWCGKPFDKKAFLSRQGASEISAIKQDLVFEIPSSVILQPGPALFKEGLKLVDSIIEKF